MDSLSSIQLPEHISIDSLLFEGFNSIVFLGTDSIENKYVVIKVFDKEQQFIF